MSHSTSSSGGGDGETSILGGAASALGCSSGGNASEQPSAENSQSSITPTSSTTVGSTSTSIPPAAESVSSCPGDLIAHKRARRGSVTIKSPPSPTSHSSHTSMAPTPSSSFPPSSSQLSSSGPGSSSLSSTAATPVTPPAQVTLHSLNPKPSRPAPILRRRMSSFVRFHQEVSQIDSSNDNSSSDVKRSNSNSSNTSTSSSGCLGSRQRRKSSNAMTSVAERDDECDDLSFDGSQPRLAHVDSASRAGHADGGVKDQEADGIDDSDVNDEGDDDEASEDVADGSGTPDMSKLYQRFKRYRSPSGVVSLASFFDESSDLPMTNLICPFADPATEAKYQNEYYASTIWSTRSVYAVAIILRILVQMAHIQNLANYVGMLSPGNLSRCVFILAAYFGSLLLSFYPHRHFNYHHYLGCFTVGMYVFMCVFEARLFTQELMNVNKTELAMRHLHPDRGLFFLLADLAMISFSSIGLVSSIFMGSFAFATVSSWWMWLALSAKLINTSEFWLYNSAAALSLCGFYTFQFNHEYSSRYEFARQLLLKKTNTLLEAEISHLRDSTKGGTTESADGGSHFNVSSPIEVITDLLKMISSDPMATASHVTAVNKVIDLLTTEQLYSPRLVSDQGDKMDKDTMSWLQSEVHLGERKPSNERGKRTHLSGDKSPHRRLSHPDLPPYLPADMTALLLTFPNWGFDLFAYRDIAQGSPLKQLFLTIAYEHHLIDELKIDVCKLTQLLTTIERGYNSHVLYHNNLHAADVLQTLHNLVAEPALLDRLKPVEKFAIFFAAACHDLNHPGVSNSFMVKTKSQLALLYNDQSVLENHHLAETFKHLYSSDLNVLGHLPQADQETARRIIIDLVLATDMARHFSFVSTFNSKISAGNLGFSWSEDLTLVFQMLIKCADVSNPGKPQSVYLQWVSLITEEFFRQGDEEKRRGMPVTAFMDREKPRVATSQVNFIQYICLPIFKPISEQLDRPHILKHAYENLEYFKKRQPEELSEQHPMAQPSAMSPQPPTSATTSAIPATSAAAPQAHQ